MSCPLYFRSARRHCLRQLAGAVAALSTVPAVRAQDDGLTRLVVPTAAGGPADVVARLLAGKLAESSGKQVPVENRAGANGTVAAQSVFKAPADGRTLLVATGAFTINAAVYRKLAYNAQQEFVPVAMLVSPFPLVLVTHPSVPVKTVAELVAHAKAQPKPLSYASAGAGNTTHLGGEMFEQLSGVPFEHIPYKGMSGALNDLLDGRVAFAFQAWSSVERSVKEGKLKVLAQTGQRRSPQVADIPTMDEAGVKGFELTSWIGLMAKTGTPPETIASLNAAIVKALAEPDARSKLASLGGEPPRTAPREMAAFLKRDFDQMERVAKAAKLSLDAD